MNCHTIVTNRKRKAQRVLRFLIVITYAVIFPCWGKEKSLPPASVQNEQSATSTKTDSLDTSPSTENPDITPPQNMDVFLSADSGHPTLKFAWQDKKPALAVVKGTMLEDDFNPEGTLWWVAFDESASPSLPNLKDHPNSGIQSIEAIPANETLVLLIKVNPSFTPVVDRKEEQWQISFKSQPLENVQEASVQLPQQKGERLTINLETSGKEIRFQDPKTGYEAVIIPTQKAGFGVGREYAFPELKIHKSSQGIAFELIKDDLSLQTNSDKVAITNANGFAISSLLDRTQSRKLPVAMGIFAEARDLDWVERRRKINEVLLDLPHDQHGPGELEIAWLLLGHGQAHEALGYLTHLARERPSIADSRLFLILRGLGNLLINQLPESQSLLYKVREEPEVKFWLLLINALQYPQYFGSTPKTLKLLGKNLQSAKDIVKQYPKPLRNQIVTLILMASIATRDLETLSHYLKQEDRPENLSASNVYDLARSRVLMNQGKPDAALQILGELMERGTSPIVRAIARFDYVTHRLESKVIGEKDALPQLHAIRSQWHGKWLDHQVEDYLKKREIQKMDHQPSLQQSAPEQSS